MKLRLILAALLVGTSLFAQEEEQGRRIEAGPSFLEPLQRRDSILVWDHFHYGIELKDIPEGTPISLPVIDEKTIKNTADRGLAIIGGWELDSVKVSSKRDSIARYDIRAYISVAPEIPGEFELFELNCLVGKDTLVFIHQMMDVKEPSIDLETFEPNDIKPQVKFPVTFEEAAPWAFMGLFIIAIVFLVFVIYSTIERKTKAKPAEPAHITALRKLDRYRGEKYWKPEQQKTFYSGVTDALREYIVARYGVGAMEMTTAEIFNDLKGSDIPPELYQEMKDLFERADFVKFAKFIATDEDNATVLPAAVRFVTETYEQEIRRSEPANDGEREPTNDGGEEKEVK